MNYLVQIGLVIDIIGAALLWKYGIPNRPLAKKGNVSSAYPEEFPSLDPRTEIRKYYSRLIADNLGFALLVIGFLFQFVGNFYENT